MIEDPKFRTLFQVESQEKIARLQQYLEELQSKFDQHTLENAFRHAHSLKGAARMLELRDIEKLAYQIEAQLDHARQQISPLSLQQLKELLSILENVKELAIKATQAPDNFSAKEVNNLSTNSSFSTKKNRSKAKHHLLLVDDSPAILAHYKQLLEAAGYLVTTAKDGVEALEKMDKKSFDLVVSDIQMPNIDGFKLAFILRNQPQFDHLPIIFLTSVDSTERRQLAQQMGVTAFLIKDKHQSNDLLETLSQLLQTP